MNKKASTRLRTTFITLLAQTFVAALLVAAGAAALFPFRDSLHPSLVALMFLMPIGLCTAILGLLPGIVSALAAFLLLNYFFIPPYNSFWVLQSQDLLLLVIFLVVAVVISQMVGRIKASLSAATARERETTWLYELSVSLAGQNDPKIIAHTLAEQAQVVFQATCVQVSLEDGTGTQLLFQVPANYAIPGSRPDLLIPMETAGSMIGEVCLWRSNPAMADSDKRLLRAFAGQAALALERARLSQADTRARVLEESDRLKSALLSSVSHELRTPLATIKASVSALRSDEQIDQDVRQDLLAAIEEETDNLNHLVGNLLDMSRIESGALKPQRRWNVLSEIVASALNRLRKEVSDNRIVVNIADDLPLVPVDYFQMERVFVNLVSNGLKYSPPGTKIQIQAQTRSDRELLVTVTNQGPHIPESHLARIFDKFYRVTEAEKVTGTGLGLSICKGFVEAHGGSIWAENLPVGLAFNFTLPITWEGGRPIVPVES